MKTRKELVEEISELRQKNWNLEETALKYQASKTALKDNHERFRSVVETAPNAIITADSQGIIISWNSAANKIFGYTIEESVGQPLTFIIPERFHEVHLKSRKKILSGKNRIDGIIEVIGLRKDGIEIPIELSLAKWKLHDQIYFTEIIHDITERRNKDKEIEEKHWEILDINSQLKKAFEQEGVLRDQLVNAERYASMGEMAAKISHEINNPLTVIMGQAQVQLTKKINGEIEESLTLIVEKAKEVARLTRNYMALGKPIDSKMESLNLGNLLSNTFKSFEGLGQLKNIRIKKEFSDGDYEIFGDAGKLEQVFRNLIINATDALEGKANATLTIGTRLSEHNIGVEGYVSDNGVGIKQENLDKIFDHYYTTKKSSIGTGLGLVISKEIVERMHGGKINVKSNYNKGTEFSVLIPFEPHSKTKHKILIVDDEKYITNLYSEYLTTKGFLTRVTNNSKDAVKIYKSFKPDLVLCDVDMPGLTGFDILKDIEKINLNQPFIMVTGTFLTHEHMSMLKSKKITQIIKPADLEKELLKTIEEKLSKAESTADQQQKNHKNALIPEAV